MVSNYILAYYKLTQFYQETNNKKYKSTANEKGENLSGITITISRNVRVMLKQQK